MLKTARSYLHLCVQNPGMWQTDGRTKGRTDRICHGYYSALHCEQCGRTV